MITFWSLGMIRCRVCGNSDYNFEFKVKEMMFGTKELFSYYECNECKSILIKEIPENIKQYYPDNYYSFNKVSQIQRLSLFKKFIRRAFSFLYLNKILGWILTPIVIKNNFIYLKILKTSNCNFNSKILDIGSGNGAKLLKLPDFGFKNIIGSDPFINNDIEYDNGLKIIRKNIFEFNEKFDFIMFNHSFEHMPNPDDVLKKLNSLLEMNSLSMIRIPVADSFSWRKYKECWVGLDAPRHLYIFSPKGFELFIKKFGFEVVKIVFESSEYQFLGSEQYKKNIPLLAENSFYKNISKSIFTKKQIKYYKRLAQKLNKKNLGDVACFYIKKVHDNINE